MDQGILADILGSAAGTVPGVVAVIWGLVGRLKRLENQVDDHEKKTTNELKDVNISIKGESGILHKRITDETTKFRDCTTIIKTNLSSLDTKIEVCQAKHKSLEEVLR